MFIFCLFSVITGKKCDFVAKIVKNARFRRVVVGRFRISPELGAELSKKRRRSGGKKINIFRKISAQNIL